MASIVELANTVTKNVEKLNEYASTHNITAPSFDINSPASWNFPPEAEGAAATRTAALAALKQLETALLGPKEYFTSLVQIGGRNIPIHAIIRFQLARAFPIDQEVAIADLASRDDVKIPQSDLERIVRYAVGLGIFAYGQQPTHIRHTAVSRVLQESVDLHDWTAVACDTMTASNAQVINAMSQYPGSQEPYETGFNLAHKTDLTLYQFFERHPRRAKEFTGAMDSFAKSNPGFNIKHTINGFAWDQLPQGGTVVDIGGSAGHIVFALAEAFPNLKYVVEDLPEVVKTAVVSPTLVNTVSFKAHDFFTPQPVQHAEVYMLRWILHNWPDQYAIRILRSLVPALKTGSKLLIADEIMPPRGSVPIEMELALCEMDILMTSIQNAKLRSAEEWKALVKEADPRFVFKGIKMLPGSFLAFIEHEWSDNPQA